MARLFFNPAERPHATSRDRNDPAASVQRRRSPRRFLFARLSQFVCFQLPVRRHCGRAGSDRHLRSRSKREGRGCFRRVRDHRRYPRNLVLRQQAAMASALARLSPACGEPAPHADPRPTRRRRPNRSSEPQCRCRGARLGQLVCLVASPPAPPPRPRRRQGLSRRSARNRAFGGNCRTGLLPCRQCAPNCEARPSNSSHRPSLVRHDGRVCASSS